MDWLLIFGGLQAFLAGQVPYGSPGYYSTPPFTVLFAALGLPPFWLSFALVTLVTLALYIRAYKRRAAYWLTFLPVFYVLFVGNVDLLFVSLATFIKPTRKGAFLAALLTIKPQIAVILLPFVLATMLRENKRLLLWFLEFTAMLWVLPAAFFPALTTAWITGVTSGAFGHGAANSVGLWGLPFIPPVVTGILCLLLALWGYKRDEPGVRAAMTLISPVDQWNTLPVLIETAPVRLLAPVAIAAFIIGGQTRQTAWWVTIPLAALVWQSREAWSAWLLAAIVRVYGVERVREAIKGHA